MKTNAPQDSMKGFLIFLSFSLAFLLPSKGNAQIWVPIGLHDIDSCLLENPCSLISIDTANPNNLWQIGRPDKGFFTVAYSYPNAIMTDTVYPYGENNTSRFEIAFNDLNIYPYDYFHMCFLLNFRHMIQTDQSHDGGYIEVSYDEGQTWANVVNDTEPLMFFSQNLYTATDTITGGIPAFSGDYPNWIYTRVEWIYTLPVDMQWFNSIRLRFTFKSDGIPDYLDGWMIDNLVFSYVDLPGSLEDSPDNSCVRISPNPFKENIQVDISGNLEMNELTYNVFDLCGHIVANGKLPASASGLYSISQGTTNLPGGVYTLNLNQGSRCYNLRIVKM